MKCLMKYPHQPLSPHELSPKNAVKTIYNEVPIWEWFITPIYSNLGDGLLLFLTTLQSSLKWLAIPMIIPVFQQP